MNFAGFSCNSANKEAIVLDHAGFYICKTPSITDKEPCTTYYYGAGGSEVLFATDTDALNACSACDTTTEVIIGAASNAVHGSCTNYEKINTVCTEGFFLKRITAN